MSTSQQCQCVPCVIEQGTTVTFTAQYTQFSTDDWNAALVLNNTNGSNASITNAVAVNGAFAFTLNTNFTAGLTVGQSDWVIYMTDVATGTIRKRGGNGVVNVEPDLALPIPKSIAQQQLDDLNAGMALILSNEASSFNFNGQSATLKDLEQLKSMQAYLEAKVYREKLQRDSLRGERHDRTSSPVFYPSGGGGPYPFVPPWWGGIGPYGNQGGC